MLVFCAASAIKVKMGNLADKRFTSSQTHRFSGGE
jgi:hypothetical protein